MKLLFSTLALCCITTSFAQPHNIQEVVQFIQKKVACCSVPFAASSGKKVASITIDANGNTELFYSDKSPNNNFNLFQLYKEEQSKTGIDTILKGRVIQFSVTEQRVRLIKFATAADAKEVYTAFLHLLSNNKMNSVTIGEPNFD